MAILETYHGYPLWPYLPSLPAAIIFAILFGSVTILHAIRAGRRRAWFCIPLIIGGCCEFIGYIGRALAYNATGQLGPYVMQSVLLLIAPVLFAATLYMTLGRIVRALAAEKYCLVPPRWITRVFVAGDCFSFLIQASGAGLIVRASQGSSGESSTSLGQNVIVAGLLFQILMFGVFCSAIALFHLRFRKVGSDIAPKTHWQRSLIMLYVTSVAIMTRNVFRTVQYVMGPSGYALTHEWYLYVFDSVLMLAVMGTFWGLWPDLAGSPRANHKLNSRTQLLGAPERANGINL